MHQKPLANPIRDGTPLLSPSIVLKLYYRFSMSLYPKRNVLRFQAVHLSPLLISNLANKSFQIDQTSLLQLLKEKNVDTLQNIGGVDGVASSLESNIDFGIQGDAEDITRRHETFGSNTYETPPTKSIFHFIVEAFKDLTIFILLGCATLSLAFGIKEKGIKEGWYDGGSIFVAILLVIAVSSISNFRQNRQFEKLSKVSNNIQVDVVRAGRRQRISVFEIVVGDHCKWMNPA